MTEKVPKTVIALDAMGGDFAPNEMVLGAAQVTMESSVHVTIIGDEEKISEVLDKAEFNGDQIEVVGTDEVISDDESPGNAVRQKQKASMLIAAEMCGEGKAHGVVSAGNTGAYVLSAARYIPRIPGVIKTPIATFYPTQNAQKREDYFALLLDIGANINCSATDMVQFAIMGKIYASDIKAIPDPTVALLNVGKESYKGGDKLTHVYKALESMPNINFIGNIEGNEVMKGLADVVVTEGYVGNIVMKTAEGIMETLSHLGRYAFKHRFLWRLGLIALSSGIRYIKKTTDYSEYGGAPLLGFQKIVIKAHGRSRAKAITNAIMLAAKSYRDGICDKIAAEIGQYESTYSVRGEK